MKNWLRTQDPDVIVSSSETPAEISDRVCSVPPRSPPNVIKSDDEVSESESDEDEENDDENEENDEEESSEDIEIEERKLQSGELEANIMTGDAKHQIKLKPKEDNNKKDVPVMTRKTSKPIKSSHRSLVIPSYDAAIAFFRRHNWDRHRRNRTVDVSENILKSIAVHRDEIASSRHAIGHTLATTNDSVGSSWNRTSGTPGRSISPGYPNLAAYGQNSRHNDENFKKTADKETISPNRLNLVGLSLGLNHNLYVTRDDKRKSKSVHDLSPDRPDL
ncbi:unnamed protein product [Onchocerca flexuosa]|uniref:Uncharacterized protein n=1 Tax=Onchocerca flexuosa TaxID=387005 RepID=A0A183GYB0_9BILA|nr:unnamed protein product [Onchocerca flexuosa]